MSGDVVLDLLSAIEDADGKARAARRALLLRIVDAREAGVTWTDIAAMFGVSRQAAQRKWHLPVQTEIRIRAARKLAQR